MQPINYLTPQVDPAQSLLEGIQAGNAIRQQRMIRQQEEEANNYKTELNAVLQSKDPKGFVTLMAKYPKHGEGLKKAWEAQSEEQRNSEFNSAREIFYSIQSGRPDVALSVVDEQIAAMKNSGQNPVKLEQIRKGIERNPEQASQYVAAFLSSVAPKEYGETLTKLGAERRAEEKLPAELRKGVADADKAVADAATAAVGARFAESNAVKDLEKKGWDITKIQQDIQIARENNRIAAMNAAIGREANAIKREELQMKRDEAVQRRDETMRGRVAEVESARFNIDNTLNTIDRIMANPALRDVVGPIEGSDVYSTTGAAMASKIANIANPFYTPTSADQRADAIALIETLGSQAFLSQLPLIKGMGQLSNAEGDKMQKAFQNLGRKQSEKQMVETLDEAKRLFLKARKNIAAKYGVPDTVADTPAARASTAAPAPGSSARPGAPAKSTDDILKELGVTK